MGAPGSEPSMLPHFAPGVAGGGLLALVEVLPAASDPDQQLGVTALGEVFVQRPTNQPRATRQHNLHNIRNVDTLTGVFANIT